MTPLLIVPARQLSVGRPGKNREAWPALQATLASLPADWPLVVVTDDPCLPPLRTDEQRLYLYSNETQGVAEKVRYALTTAALPVVDLVVVLQPSSPTRHRDTYIWAAVNHLASHPQHSAVIGLVPWTGDAPSKAIYLTAEGFLQKPATPEARQAHPRAYRRDGTVYAVRTVYAQAGDLYGPTPVPLLVHPADTATWD